MFLQNKGPEFAEQTKTRPKIEAMADKYEFSCKSAKEALLGFLAWLKANKFTYGWASSNAWKIAYKSKRIGTIRFHGGNLYLDPFMAENNPAYVNYLMCEKLAAIIEANIHYCVACCTSCAMSRNLTIEKKYENICCVRFTNPGPAEIECMNKLMEWYKK